MGNWCPFGFWCHDDEIVGEHGWYRASLIDWNLRDVIRFFWGSRIWIGDGLASPSPAINWLSLSCRSSLYHLLWKSCLWILLLLCCREAMYLFLLFIRWRKERWRGRWSSSRCLGVNSAQNISLRDDPVTKHQSLWQSLPPGVICLVVALIGANNLVLSHPFLRSEDHPKESDPPSI